MSGASKRVVLSLTAPAQCREYSLLDIQLMVIERPGCPFELLITRAGVAEELFSAAELRWIGERLAEFDPARKPEGGR